MAKQSAVAPAKRWHYVSSARHEGRGAGRLGSDMRILIADDHRLIVEGVKLKLAELGPETDFAVAQDVDELRDLIRSEDARQLKLAMIDLAMPGAHSTSHLLETIRALHAFGYELLEAPRDEVDLYPVNGITIEPRRVIMNASAVKTRALLERHGVEVSPIEYGEVHKYGGGIRCNTMQLVRDRGPFTFAA